MVQGFLKFTRPEDLRLQPVKVQRADRRDSADRRDPRREEQREGDARCAALGAGGQRRLGDAASGVPEPGHQRLSGDAERRARCVSSAARVARRVEVRVEDTGVGIPPEHLAEIFDLYFTTKDHGTGIGLSMVYRIIQMHDGEVEVQSTPGRGTTFRVLLPRASGI